MYPCNSWDTPPIGTADTDARDPGYLSAMLWVWSIMPYVKNRQLLACPSDPNQKDGWSGYSLDGTCNDGWGIPTPISYATNTEVLGYGGYQNPNGCFGDGSFIADWGMAPKGMAAIPSPANTYLAADYARESIESWWVNNLKAANYTRVYPNDSAPGGGLNASASDPWWQRKDNPAIYRHQGGTNIIFGDGHAKFRNGNQITSGDDYVDAMPDGKHSTEGIVPRQY
jgi:prepilin-type processing-associated H-X9-DG protein